MGVVSRAPLEEEAVINDNGRVLTQANQFRSCEVTPRRVMEGKGLLPGLLLKRRFHNKT